ncbi:hypothetical protein AGR6A_Cc100042 [Agrobacterium sp. NCPPB 925]|nr:hypothetical protein AGR6A_Cc100042 [Agrobacterium sp. NCPPB 925]
MKKLTLINPICGWEGLFRASLSLSQWVRFPSIWEPLAAGIYTARPPKEEPELEKTPFGSTSGRAVISLFLTDVPQEIGLPARKSRWEAIDYRLPSKACCN